MKIKRSSWFQHLRSLDWNVAESCKLVEEGLISKTQAVEELNWALTCLEKMTHEIEKKLLEVSDEKVSS